MRVLRAGSVPVRTLASFRTVLDLRSMFLLMHVDESTSVVAIARMAQLPLAEAMECFAELLPEGLVELVDGPSANADPSSGVYACADGSDDDVGS